MIARIEGHELRLELTAGARLVFGRAKECDVVVESPLVSSKHLELLWDGRKLSIADLGSKHGTKVGKEGGLFKRKVFAPAPTDLILHLADVELSLQWGLGPVDGERTQFSSLENERTVAIEKTEREQVLFPALFFR